MSNLPPDGPDYGPTPPSGGNYGGYGGYGQTPPPPPNFDKPGPTPGGNDWAVGDALTYGWTKFAENLGQILLAALLLLGSLIVVAAVSIGLSVLVASGNCEIRSGALTCSANNWFVDHAVQTFQQFLASIVMTIASAILLRGALDITEGRRFEVGTAMSRIPLVPVIVAGLLVSLITAVGFQLLWVPGLIAMFVFLFTPFFVLDKGDDGVKALATSVTFTRDNLANMLIWAIVGGIVFLVGICLCGVGLLITAPVVLIGAAYTYKKLTGQPVAP